jgi:hypothetical protein
MYGLGDEISGQAEDIERLKGVLLLCKKYIRKLPNDNELEKILLLDRINKELK